MAYLSLMCKTGKYRHSGIAGPWTCVLDSEMLDSGPIFPEISAQKHTKVAAYM